MLWITLTGKLNGATIVTFIRKRTYILLGPTEDTAKGKKKKEALHFP